MSQFPPHHDPSHHSVSVPLEDNAEKAASTSPRRPDDRDPGMYGSMHSCSHKGVSSHKGVLPLSDVLSPLNMTTPADKTTPDITGNPEKEPRSRPYMAQQRQASWQRIQAKLRKNNGEEFYQQKLLPLHVSDQSQEHLICLSGMLRLNAEQQERLRQRLLVAWQAENPAISQLRLDVQQAASLPNRTVTEWDSTFTFARFITGRSNEFALAAARKVATSKQSPYTPLFLHGGVGLGKTHLLTAIAHERMQRFPEQKILLMTAEMFMRRFVTSLRKRDNMQFKQQFDNVDLLLIDDVHFLANKTSTQEEFFHILNGLVANRVPVVVTSDRAPHHIESLDTRVCSRLASGLVTEIQTADQTLRHQYLQWRIDELDIACEAGVIPFITNNLPVSIRELEGAINRIRAMDDLMNAPINVASCRHILRDLLQQPKLRLSMHAIQRCVANHFGLQADQLTAISRRRVIVRPRQVAMYLCKQLTPRSLPEIGRQFGGRDHTTVLHAIRNIEKLCLTDPALAEDIRHIKQTLQS